MSYDSSLEVHHEVRGVIFTSYYVDVYFIKLKEHEKSRVAHHITLYR
jgi:hypothetical protein